MIEIALSILLLIILITYVMSGSFFKDFFKGLFKFVRFYRAEKKKLKDELDNLEKEST